MLSIKNLIYLILAYIFISSALEVGSFYYTQEELAGIFESQAKISSLKTDEEIRAFVKEKVKEYQINIKDFESKLQISRNFDNITISLNWQEHFYLELPYLEPYFIHTFYMHAEGSAKI